MRSDGLTLLALLAGTSVTLAQASPIFGSPFASGSQLRLREVALPPRAQPVVAVVQADDGVPWLGSRNRVWRFDADGWQQVATEEIGDAEVRALGALPGSGQVLIGTNHGVWIAEPRQGTTPGWRSLRSTVSVRPLPSTSGDDCLRILPQNGPLYGAVLVLADGHLRWVRIDGSVTAAPPLEAIGPAEGAFAVRTRGPIGIVAARGGRAIGVLSADGATAIHEIPEPILGRATISDAVFDHDRQMLFVATSSRVLAMPIGGEFKVWSEAEANALGLFGGRLLVLQRVAAPGVGVEILGEQRLTGSSTMSRIGKAGGPTGILEAQQIDADLVWVTDELQTSWEWSPNGWSRLDIPRLDLHGVTKDLSVPRLLRTSDGSRVLACLPAHDDGWTLQRSDALLLTPDPTGEGFWACDAEALAGHSLPSFVTPHSTMKDGVVVEMTTTPERVPPPTVKPRLRARPSVPGSKGPTTHAFAADGRYLLLPFGEKVAICRGGECRIDSLPEPVESLVPAGDSSFAAAYLGLKRHVGSWQVVAVGVTSESAPTLQIVPNVDFDLPLSEVDPDPVLLPDSRGSVWLANRRSRSWQATKILPTGRGEVVELGPLPEPPVILEPAETLGDLGDRVVATAHGIQRVPRLGRIGEWQRLFTTTSIHGIGPGWSRPAALAYEYAILTTPNLETGFGRAMSMSIVVPGNHTISGPAGSSDAALMAVLPEGSGEPARALWSDAAENRTLVEWNKNGESAVRTVPGLAAARAVAVIDDPKVLAGAVSVPTRMLAVVDGNQVAIQRLPRDARWSDSAIVAPIGVVARSGDKVLLELAPLTRALPDELPAGTTHLDIRLAVEPSSWWCEASAEVSLDGQLSGPSPGGDVTLAVQPGREHTLTVLAKDRTGIPSFASNEWRFRVPTTGSWPWPTLIGAIVGVIAVPSAIFVIASSRRRRPRATPGTRSLPPDANVHTFIAYSRKDEAYVRELARAIDALGAGRGVKTWYDQRDIPVGSDWDRCIDDALERCRFFLIALSPTSVASRDVRSEMHRAFELHRTIVPVLHQQCDIPRRIALIEHVNAIGRRADDTNILTQILDLLGDGGTVSGTDDAAAAIEPATLPTFVRVHYQNFDVPELVTEDERSTWIVPHHPSWRTSIGDGVLHWVNDDEAAAKGSLVSSMRYRIGDRELPLGDGRISCRVRVSGRCGPDSGAGLVFRWREDLQRGYTLFLQQGRTVTLFLREGDSMRAQWSMSDVDVDAHGMVQLEVRGLGSKLELSVAGRVAHTIDAAAWLDGQPGIGAYGLGDFAFDDVALFRLA